MKKFALVLMLFVIVLSACQVSKYAAKTETKTLSDMQATACNAANDARTCGTRLPELGIVSKEDCCRNLGKCC